MGFDVHRSTGALRTVLGAVGGHAAVRPAAARGARRRAGSACGSPSRTSSPAAPSSRRTPSSSIDDVRIGGDEVIVMAGPVLGGDRGAGRGDGGGGASAPAPRSCAAARSSRAARPYSFQGLGEEGLRMLRARGRSPQPEAGLRGHGHQPARADREVLRHPPGRRAQHAELHAAARARAHADAGPAQARHLGDDRGVAAVGRVHPRRRQHERDALRARHPHVRELHAQHARHLGDPGRAEAQSPADPRRSEPRHRDGATRSRRWRAPRSPPAPTAC